MGMQIRSPHQHHCPSSLLCIAQVAAKATAIGSVAIHQLLLAELHQFSGRYLEDALKVGHCRERPARSTLRLIFDSVDGAMVTPVITVNSSGHLQKRTLGGADDTSKSAQSHIELFSADG